MRARNYRIDVLRIVSAFFIVIIHVVSSSVTHNDKEVAQIVVEILNIVHNLSSWAVPVFFMISGFCILGDDSECTWQWVMQHIKKYIGILFTIGLFYSLLERAYIGKTISVRMIGLALIDVVNGKSWDHMWFIYSIIGIYLVLPLIKSYIIQNDKNIYYLSGLLFLFTILIPAINKCLNLSIGVELPVSGYLFYVSMGAMIARCNFKYIKYIKLIFIVAIVTVSAYLVCCGKNRIYSYTSLSVCIMAVGIFLLGVKNHINISGEKILGLSQCTLGIYLIHPFFLNLMLRLLHIYPLHFNAWFSIPVTCIFLFLLSYVVVYVLRKIPGVKWLF